MADFLKSNIGFDRSLKQKFSFVDYFPPMELSHIFTSKLLKQKMRFPYGGMEPEIADCFNSIPKEIRANHNVSLVDDLLRDIKYAQEQRLSFNFTLAEATKYTTDDIKIGIKSFLQQYSRKRGEKLTKATSYQVMLHIKGVGIVPRSPI